jgi:quinol monooxygenase YgiN
MIMERIVIACYRPKPGQAEQLRELMKTHLSTLQAEGLVTDRLSIMMEASDGTIIEVFEWKSRAAIEQAHANPAVGDMWAKYAQVCDYVPIADVAEAQQLFSEFAPLPRR